MAQGFEIGKKVQIEIQQLWLGHDFDHFKKRLNSIFWFCHCSASLRDCSIQRKCFHFFGHYFCGFYSTLCEKAILLTLLLFSGMGDTYKFCGQIYKWRMHWSGIFALGLLCAEKSCHCQQQETFSIEICPSISVVCTSGIFGF